MRRLRRLLASPSLIGILLLGTLLTFYHSNHPLIERLRFRTFDTYQQWQPRQPDPKQMEAEVVIIDLDEASLQAYGQWPWPRTLISELVDKLLKAQTLSVGFDMIFPEPDRMSPGEFANQSKALPKDIKAVFQKMPDHESLMAEQLKGKPVVLGQVGINDPTRLKDLPRKVGFAALGGDPMKFVSSYRGVVRNHPVLEQAATGIGLFSTQPSHDGIYRKVTLIERIGNELYPTLSLEVLRVALRGKDDYIIKMLPDGGGIKSIVVKNLQGGGFEIPTTHRGEVWVHYARYFQQEPLYVSAKTVMELPTEELARKVGMKLAIIGTSAAGLKDIRATPINAATPGVEVHAQVLENILSHTHLNRPAWVIMLEFSLILLGGIALIILVPRLNAIWNFLFSSGLIALLVAGGWHYYTTQQILVDIAYPALSIFTLFSVLSYLNYAREERERRQVRLAFSHYVSPALLDDLAANPEKLRLGGETKNITLLFSDIRGFTTISEQFDAQGLTRFINRFLTPMTHIVLDEKGTVDKYMGDALMAFWNAPLDVPDHPAHACRAALNMQVAVEKMNQTLKAEMEQTGGRHIPISIGIGLNTGDCCVGNMGSDLRFDYSALGDDVNLASRLEGQSKTYGVGIVVSENTYRRVEQDFAFLELDLIQVKGKTEPVRIFALLGDRQEAESPRHRETALGMLQMLAAYRQQRFEEAGTFLAQMQAARPDLEGLWSLYAERLEEYRLQPPSADWKGVFIAKNK